MIHFLSNFGYLNIALVSFMIVFSFTLGIAMLKEKDKAVSKNSNNSPIFQKEYRPGKFHKLITVLFGIIGILIFLSIKDPSLWKSILLLSSVLVLLLGIVIAIIKHLADVLMKKKAILMGGVYFDNPNKFVKYVFVAMYVFGALMLLVVSSIFIRAIYEMTAGVLLEL